MTPAADAGTAARDVDVPDLARRLEAAGEPFVVATVVWRRSPSSGKVGSRALITADGAMRGWIGGACAEPAVVSEARRALEEGTPRLMFLGPAEELAGHRRDGVVSVPIACQSEGALEVYVEPVVPKPNLIVVGRSPAVDALARMGAALGWTATVVDDGGAPADHPGVDRVVTSLDLGAAGAASFVVVATQGHYDEDALRAALATEAAYVGLVASRKRAEAVLGYLRDQGVAEDQLSRVHAPAGLDLGPVAPAEIAVAIVAELVELRSRGEIRTGPPALPPVEHEEVDPVCGMTVKVATARHVSTYGMRTVYFCNPVCKRRFDEEPERYAPADR